jgi:hypothetical protein
MYWHKQATRAVESLGTLLLVVVKGAAWFAVYDWLYAAGTQLAQAVQFYHSSKSGGGGLFWMPDINNTLGSIIGLGGIVFWGMLLVSIFYVYSLVVLIVRPLGFIALALYPLGDRSKKFFDWCVAISLVALLFGPAAAIFSLEVGKAAYDSLGGGGWLASVVALTSGFIMAVVMQFVLIVVTHKGVNKFTTNGRNWVRGSVESTIKRLPDSPQTVQAAYGGSFMPMPVTLVSEKPGFGRTAAGAARDGVLFAGAEAIAAKTAASATGVGAAVAAGATIYAKRKANRPVN